MTHELLKVDRFMVVYTDSSCWGPTVQIIEALDHGPIHECWKITGSRLSKFWACFGLDHDGWPHERSIPDAVEAAKKWIKNRMKEEAQHNAWVKQQIAEVRLDG